MLVVDSTRITILFAKSMYDMLQPDYWNGIVSENANRNFQRVAEDSSQ